MIYKQVFDLKKVPDQFRDSLDKNDLYQLQLVEWKVAEWLNNSINSCFDYHEPYSEIKRNDARISHFMLEGKISKDNWKRFNWGHRDVKKGFKVICA